MVDKLGSLSPVLEAKIPEAMPTRATDARYREAIPQSSPLYFLTYRCNHRALRGHVQPLDELITPSGSLDSQAIVSLLVSLASDWLLGPLGSTSQDSQLGWNPNSHWCFASLSTPLHHVWR